MLVELNHSAVRKHSSNGPPQSNGSSAIKVGRIGGSWGQMGRVWGGWGMWGRLGGACGVDGEDGYGVGRQMRVAVGWGAHWGMAVGREGDGVRCGCGTVVGQVRDGCDGCGVVVGQVWMALGLPWGRLQQFWGAMGQNADPLLPHSERSGPGYSVALMESSWMASRSWR